MPFRNLSQESDTAYFANGFVEDLTANLTRFTSLRVLATQSAFALGQPDRGVDEFAQDWNLDFLLEGSVRRGAESLRVGVQLIRVQGRETVWAERFDAPLDTSCARRRSGRSKPDEGWTYCDPLRFPTICNGLDLTRELLMRWHAGQLQSIENQPRSSRLRCGIWS